MVEEIQKAQILVYGPADEVSAKCQYLMSEGFEIPPASVNMCRGRYDDVYMCVVLEKIIEIEDDSPIGFDPANMSEDAP